MSVVKSPPTPFPAFVWPAVDTSIAPTQLATQLNTRLKQLEATMRALTTVAQGTANWTHVTSLNYPPKATDQTLALDATGGNVSAVLPVSQNAPGKVYRLIRTDSSGNTAVATLQGADLFEPGGGTSLTVTTAGQAVQSDGQGHWWIVVAAGSGAVSSVFTRTGAVTAQSGDYSLSQITGGYATQTSVQTISSQLTLTGVQATGFFYYLTASGGNQIVQLPTHSAGQNVSITNAGASNNLTVNDSSSVLQITLAPGMSAFLNDDGTVWRIH